MLYEVAHLLSVDKPVSNPIHTVKHTLKDSQNFFGRCRSKKKEKKAKNVISLNSRYMVYTFTIELRGERGDDGEREGHSSTGPAIDSPFSGHATLGSSTTDARVLRRSVLDAEVLVEFY